MDTITGAFTGLFAAPWEMIEAGLVLVLTYAVSAVLLAVRRYFGDRAEAVLLAALDEAIDRAIALADARGEPDVPAAAANYLQETKPDTVRRLGATTAALRRRIQAQISSRAGG